jgi:demethylmenaquinone methyltransferase/2-methoxy-6-polyprenyl-1,4-benzoquinol methylase
MLLVAKEKRQERLLECDALQLPVRDQAFDAVTIAFGLRNMESWPGVLHEVARVLRPDGHLLILDFSIPSGRLRPAYRWYLHHVLPSVAGIVTGERSAYTYLADSIEAFPQGEEMLSLIGAEGFSDRTARSLHGGIVSIYTGRR